MINLKIGDKIKNDGDIYMLCLDDNETDLYLKPTHEELDEIDETYKCVYCKKVYSNENEVQQCQEHHEFINEYD